MKAAKKKESPQNVFKFLLQKSQKIDLLAFTSAYIIIYFIIKTLYPYPDQTADTGNYILCAKKMTIGGYRPIGYSWFLNYFHQLSESIHFIFIAQLFLHAVATLSFIFTVKFYYPVKNIILYYLFAFFLIISPNTLKLTNLILSDTIFNSLTLMFITTLFWITQSKNSITKGIIIFIHILLLYLAFNVRYSALFYPAISLICLLFLSKNKMLGAAISLIPIFVIFGTYKKTKSQMNKHIGIDTFSGFSGWAMANNAVSIIPYIDLKPNEIKDKKSAFIHSVVKQFPDSVYSKKRIIATDFMWNKKSSGKQAFFQIRKTNNMSYVKGWVYSGLLLNKYAITLIKKYPYQYFKHFILMNTKQVFKFFNIWNPKTYKPDKLQKEWFNLDIEEYKFTSEFFKKINPVLMIFHYLRWILFISASLFLMIKIKSLDFNNYQRKLFWIIIIFIVFYIGFSIISHPVNNFRYMTPTYIYQLFVIYTAGIGVLKILNKRKIKKEL